MSSSISRRHFLSRSGIAVVSTALAGKVQACAKADVLGTNVISRLEHRYHGWPTLAKRASGELLLVCSGGREKHVCPFGRVELMRSKDEGQTWSWPEVLMDGPIDDRDAGVLETSQGTLLVTTFTSLAYEANLKQLAKDESIVERFRAWRAAHDRVGTKQRQAALGVWMKRSTDSGVTWSGRYDSLLNSPHGPIQLTDGRLLYAGKELYREPHRIGVCESRDDGQSWNWLATIPPREGDNHRDYHELHAVETVDGSLLVHIRNHNATNSRETLQCKSTDGGKTWSVPRSIGVWGLPSHLLRLRDGRLLMSYGHRRKPFGNQSRISEDGGQTWSEAFAISADGSSGDLGYPSTVQLSDGSLLTAWYEKLKNNPFAQLRQARWKLS